MWREYQEPIWLKSECSAVSPVIRWGLLLRVEDLVQWLWQWRQCLWRGPDNGTAKEQGRLLGLLWVGLCHGPPAAAAAAAAVLGHLVLGAPTIWNDWNHAWSFDNVNKSKKKNSVRNVLIFISYSLHFDPVKTMVKSNNPIHVIEEVSWSKNHVKLRSHP